MGRMVPVALRIITSLRRDVLKHLNSVKYTEKALRD
jgi:hypothetical protein